MDTFQSPYLPQAVREPELKPTFFQIMKSSFNMESDLVNWIDYFSTPTFKPNPQFNFMDKFKASKLPVNFGQYLANANSEEEYNFLLAKTQKEQKDQAVIAAGGWTATIAQLGAGVLSPAIFMPFAGQARGGMAFAEVLGLAAVGSAAQNLPMYFNQTTRTEAELYTGIAFDTLLGGLLGGAWLGLSKEGRSRLIGDVQVNQNKVVMPDGEVVENPSFMEEFEADEVEVPTASRQTMTARTDVEDAVLAVPVRNRPLAKQPLALKQDLAGLNYAEAPIADGVVARFSKSPDVDGGYKIKLFDGANNELPLREINADNEGDFEDMVVYADDATMSQAYEAGAMDEQLQGLLRGVDDTGMAVTGRTAAIPDSTSRAIDTEAVGAQVTRSRNTGGTARAPNKARQAAMNILGKAHPTYRLANQPFFPSARDGIMKLDNGGLRQAGLDTREASPDGGEVLSRTRAYDYYVFAFTKALDLAWMQYHLGGKAAGVLDANLITQTQSIYGRQVAGKLNWPQFKEAVFDGLNTGQVEVPEVKAAVDAFAIFFSEYNKRHKQYLAEFAARGMDVLPLYKELMQGEFGEGIENYAHHIFDSVKIMDNIPEFLEDFGGYNNRQLAESFDRAFGKYTKKQLDLEVEREYNSLSTSELSGVLDEVESDLEFLEEIPAWADFRAERLDLNRQAKAEGWSKERLKTEQDALKERASEELLTLQDERKVLMARAKTIRNLGGDSNKVMEKLKGDLAKADDLIAGMLRTTLPQLQKADLSIARLQKDGDKIMKKATTDIRKVVEAMSKRQAQMRKLLTSKRTNSNSRAKVAEHIEALGIKHKSMLERLSAVEGTQLTINDRLTEVAALREEAVREGVTLVRSRAARAGDLEDKLEAAEAKIVTPEDKLRIGDQISEELLELERNFETKWRDRGNAADDMMAGKSDFNSRSTELATMLMQKLTNSEIELSPAWLSLRQDARGAALLRVMKIPYDIKNKWLVKDVERVARSLDRSMAPDLELWRAFEGSPAAKSLLGEMQTELTEHLVRIGTAKYVKLPKGWVDKSDSFIKKAGQRLALPGQADELFIGPKNFSNDPGEGFVEISDALRTQLAETFTAAGKEYTESVDVAIQRLRAMRGRPKDSNNGWWRLGKSIKELNVTTMMGGVVTSSLSDVAQPIGKYGVQKVFRTSWAPFIKSFTSIDGKAYRIQSREINSRVLANIEPLLQSRGQAMFDTMDETIGRTMVERGITMASQKMGVVALFSQWTSVMKSMAGNVTHATMAEYIPSVAKGWSEGVEPTGDMLEMRTYLRNRGLTDMDIFRISQEMEKPGGVETFSNGGVLPNIGAWENAAAYQAYQAAVISDINNMIVTPGLEKPEFIDANMGFSMLAQFKGFTFASNSRVTMSKLQGNDPYLIQGIGFSLAMGALSYYTYAYTVGGKTWEEAMKGDADNWAWESFKRSGLMGLMSLPTDIAMKIPSVTSKEESEMFLKTRDLGGSLFGPTFTQVDKLLELVQKMGSDDEKQQDRNAKTLRQVFVPFQNVFYFRQLLDRASTAMFGD